MYLNSAGKLPQKSGTSSFTVKADINEIQCDLFKGKKLTRDVLFYPLCLLLLFSSSHVIEQRKKNKSHSITKISKNFNS